jgi:hypothetical protein
MPGEGVAPSIVVRFFWKNVLGNPLIPYIRKIRYFAAQTKYCRGGCGMYLERKKERRRFGGKTLFPLVTNGGYQVENDRRDVPDRRLGNIDLELIDTENYRFTECFTSTSLFSSGKKDD